jgi:hypothetical protein
LLPVRTPQGTWARNDAEKAHAFAKQKKVFQPHPLENTPEEEETDMFSSKLKISAQNSLPLM